jgi:PAS domain S-box-containing protein
LFNGTCEKLTGYKFNEVIGKNIFDLFIPEKDKKHINTVFNEVLLNDHKFKKHENIWVTKNKEEILIRWSNTHLNSENTNGLLILSTGIDITKERENENLLINLNYQLGNTVKDITKENEKLNKNLFKKNNLLNKINTNIPAIIYLLDIKSKKITLINNSINNSTLFPVKKDIEIDFKKFASYFNVSDSKTITIKFFLDELNNKEYELKLDRENYFLQHKIVSFEYDNQNKPFIYLGVLTDVTYLKTIQNRLEESQKIAHIGTWDWNIETNDLYWSDEIYRIFELDPKVFTPSYTSFLEIIHQEDRQLLEKAVNYAIEHKSPYELIHRLETQPGKIKFVIENGFCQYDENGKATRMLGTVRDITESEYTKKRLEEAQNLAKIGTWEFNTVTNEFFSSSQLYSIYEVNPNEKILTLDYIINHIHPEDQALVIETPNKAAKNKESFAIEYRIITDFNTTKYVSGRGYAEYNSKGEIIKLIGSVQDVSTERILQNSLIASEEKYRLLSDNNQDLISLRDTNGKALYISNSVEKLLGYTVEEYSEKNLFELMHPDDAILVRESTFNPATMNRAVGLSEARIKHKNGEYVWMNTVTSPVFDENGNVIHIIGSTRDVTARKNLELSITDSERKYRALFDNALVGIFRTNIIENKPIDVNEVCFKLFGYDSKDEFLNNCNSSVGYANQEERDGLFHELKEIYVIENREVLFVRKDGTTFWGNTSLKLLPGNEIMEGVIVDISLSKKYENELEKNLNEKDLFLKEIHHRVKNNLQIISSLLKLQIKKNDHPILREALTESRERVRAIALIHERMYLSEDIATINFCEYLSNLTKSIHLLHKDKKIKLVLNLDRFITDINIAIPLALVCHEIISNSYKHAFNTNNSGELCLDLKNNSNKITIQISDNGSGFNIQGIDQTKSLGWSLIYNLAKQAKAAISVKSDPNYGSEFLISL